MEYMNIIFNDEIIVGEDFFVVLLDYILLTMCDIFCVLKYLMDLSMGKSFFFEKGKGLVGIMVRMVLVFLFLLSF